MSEVSLRRTMTTLPRRVIAAMASGPQVLAFLPAVTLAAYWLGGESYLLVTAVVVPALFAASGLFTLSRAPAESRMEGRMASPAAPPPPPGPKPCWVDRESQPNLAVLAIGLDDSARLEDRLGPAAFRDR
jgi:diguanylate cyclase